MAVIHPTTMSPGKLELLTAWLPTRPWYRDSGRAPELSKAGGFRLDDPAGEVGIEFMLVTDSAGPEAVTYHLPLTYRGAPLDGADDALVGTSVHGVLGQRWIYDGTRDPVAVAQIVALLAGRVRPQAQSESDTPDPSVIVTIGEFAHAATEFASTTEGWSYTDIAVDGGSRVRVERALHRAPVSADAPSLGRGSEDAPNSEANPADVPGPGTGPGNSPSSQASPAVVLSPGATLTDATSSSFAPVGTPAVDRVARAQVTMPWQLGDGSTVRGVVLAIEP